MIWHFFKKDFNYLSLPFLSVLLILLLLLLFQQVLLQDSLQNEYTSTHIQLTHQQVVSSTMFVDTKVLHLMTLDCSTAHMFHYRWFVQLERTPSNQKLDLRPATVWSQTHSQKDLQQDMVVLRLTPMYTTDVYRLLTSCKQDAYISSKTSFTGGLFLCYNK